jgi:V/A-type H+-transporting ATPase subunit A
MLKVILEFYHLSKEKLKEGMDFEKVIKLPLREKISRLKYILEYRLKDFEQIKEELRRSYA